MLLPIVLCSAALAPSPLRPAATQSLGRAPHQASHSRRAVLGLAASFAAAGTRSAAFAAEELQFQASTSGVQWAERKVGAGAAPVAGQQVIIEYVMYRKGGDKVDSTVARQEPFSWRLGDGSVIEGLEQGVVGGQGVPPLLPGGVRRLIVPQARGYVQTPIGLWGSGDGEEAKFQGAKGPIPPEDSEGYRRFKDLFLNPNRWEQPDLVFDVVLRKVVADAPPAAVAVAAPPTTE